MCNVVYKAECQDCVKEVENKVRARDDVGLYIGETSRSLFERVGEHENLAANFDKKSFIMKHWVASHKNLPRHPEMKYSVERRHKSALTRLLHEAIKIDEEGNLNSKSEWRYNRKSRLVLENTPWEERILTQKEEEKEKREQLVLEELKSKFYVEKKKKGDRKKNRESMPDTLPTPKLGKSSQMKRRNQSEEDTAGDIDDSFYNGGRCKRKRNDPPPPGTVKYPILPPPLPPNPRPPPPPPPPVSVGQVKYNDQIPGARSSTDLSAPAFPVEKNDGGDVNVIDGKEFKDVCRSVIDVVDVCEDANEPGANPRTDLAAPAFPLEKNDGGDVNVVDGKEFNDVCSVIDVIDVCEGANEPNNESTASCLKKIQKPSLYDRLTRKVSVLQEIRNPGTLLAGHKGASCTDQWQKPIVQGTMADGRKYKVSCGTQLNIKPAIIKKQNEKRKKRSVSASNPSSCVIKKTRKKKINNCGADSSIKKITQFFAVTGTAKRGQKTEIRMKDAAGHERKAGGVSARSPQNVQQP